MRTCTFSYKQFSSRIEIENSQKNECCCLVHALLSNGIRNEKKAAYHFSYFIRTCMRNAAMQFDIIFELVFMAFFLSLGVVQRTKRAKSTIRTTTTKKGIYKKMAFHFGLALSLCICEKFYVAHESERRRYTQFSNTFLYVLSSIILFVFFSMHLMIEQSDFFFQCSH